MSPSRHAGVVQACAGEHPVNNRLLLSGINRVCF